MNNKFFSERVRLLRQSQSLSLNQLADILGKNKSAIAEIEAGRVGATLEALSNIADLFAVSTDWLLGRVDEPYYLPVIEAQERKLLDLEKSINLEKITGLIYIKLIFQLYRLTEVYWPNKESYTLDHRADVIYALNFLIYFCNRLNANNNNNDNIKAFQEVIKEKELTDFGKNLPLKEIAIILQKEVSALKTMIETFSSTYSSKRAGNSFAKLCYGCIDIFQQCGQDLDELPYGLVKTNNLRDLCKKCNGLG